MEETAHEIMKDDCIYEKDNDSVDYNYDEEIPNNNDHSCNDSNIPDNGELDINSNSVSEPLSSQENIDDSNLVNDPNGNKTHDGYDSDSGGKRNSNQYIRRVFRGSNRVPFDITEMSYEDYFKKHQEFILNHFNQNFQNSTNPMSMAMMNPSGGNMMGAPNMMYSNYPQGSYFSNGTMPYRGGYQGRGGYHGRGGAYRGRGVGRMSSNM